jgi:TolB-like protein
LLVGFPIALILAWAYDVTPQGIQATPTSPGTHRRRNIIALTAIGLAISAVAGFFLFPRASGRSVEKSIAVLPFQSLSDEKENAYFADGIQDDILTNLSKIGDLKVISRMSVMSYRGDALRNAREIGKALGVGALLEGSVRRAGNRVRVSVQLINANNDEHIWAEDYDRDLTDVFAIQTDLAQKIASALQAKLSPNEKARLDQRPTENSDAYLLFVQAHDYATRRNMFRDTSLKAIPLFEQAIKLDPKFALAFAGLSMVQSWIYHNSVLTRTKRCDCNQICPRAISHSVSRIIMATAITRALSPNSKLPGAIYRMTLKPISPSAQSSDDRASGRSPRRIWKKPPPWIQETQRS